MDTLFLMRSVLNTRANAYGEPGEFIRDMCNAMDRLNSPDSENLDNRHGFFTTMLTLKLLRFANNPHGNNGKECMLDLANYAVLCLSELMKEDGVTIPAEKSFDEFSEL